MKRYVRVIGIVALVGALLGAPAVASASTDDTVSHILLDRDSLKMVGCSKFDSADSVLSLSFTSTGLGSVTVKAVSVDQTTVVGSSTEKVSSENTKTTLAIHNGFVGEAVVSVEGANYEVPLGEKGDQSARDQATITVGDATCAAGSPSPGALTPVSSSSNDRVGSFLEIAGFIAIVVVVSLVLYPVLRKFRLFDK